MVGPGLAAGSAAARRWGMTTALFATRSPTRSPATWTIRQPESPAQITDHPELVRARLNGKLAPAPARQLDEVNTAYQVLRHHPSPTPAPSPVIEHAPTDRALDVEPIGLQVDA